MVEIQPYTKGTFLENPEILFWKKISYSDNSCLKYPFFFLSLSSLEKWEDSNKMKPS